MSISVHYENNAVKHILVFGDLNTTRDEQSFISMLDEKNDMKLHITFSDAGIISPTVVDKLSILQRDRKIKIFVFKLYLFSYLYKMGIQCEYIKKKSLKSRLAQYPDEISSDNLDTENISSFLNDVYIKYGYDYRQYHVESIIRRIKISMLRKHISNFREFTSMILENEEQFEQLFLDFSINTTEFFRDPEVYDTVRKEILPNLNSFARIKIWCAGCSTGQEPYSLAIILYELGMLDKTQIYATDINPYVLQEAKNGLYPTDTVDTNIINYRKTGGQKSFINYFKLKGKYMAVRQELRNNILFFQHSLCGQGILNEFHLIFCRNVLIYFNSDLQQKVVELFSYSLEQDGFLVLGKSEGLLLNNGYLYFDKYKDDERIFKRK